MNRKQRIIKECDIAGRFSFVSGEPLYGFVSESHRPFARL